MCRISMLRLFSMNALIHSKICRFYSTGALENIRILDLTRIVAGPYCTMILGDMGAEVIKVEQLGTGDETRLWPPYTFTKSNLSCYFAALNRNKKSLCVNFKSNEGKQLIYELAKKCDVLIENYVPGKLDTLGLGYDFISSIAPHIVYCSLSGYGPKGPYKSRPGFDVIAASEGGLIDITGPTDGEPCKVGVPMTDIATGLYAHGAILAALLERTISKKGQKIDCNLLSTQLACLIHIGSNYLNVNIEGTRRGTAHESIVPYQAFRTADGYITIGAGSNSQFASLCEKLNVDRLVTDERFSSNQLRVLNRHELIDILSPYFLEKETSTLMKMFKGATFPHGPINQISEVFEDPHINDIGIVKEIPFEDTNLKVVGPPVEFSHLNNAVRSPPPKLAQHTTEILKQLLNYSDKQIYLLKSNNIIQ